MSLARKSVRLLALLCCVSLSIWAIGCGQPAGGNAATTSAADDSVVDDPAVDDSSSGSGSDDAEAGSGESDGGATEGTVVPLPADEAGSATEPE